MQDRLVREPYGSKMAVKVTDLFERREVIVQQIDLLQTSERGEVGTVPCELRDDRISLHMDKIQLGNRGEQSLRDVPLPAISDRDDRLFFIIDDLMCERAQVVRVIGDREREREVSNMPTSTSKRDCVFDNLPAFAKETKLPMCILGLTPNAAWFAADDNWPVPSRLVRAVSGPASPFAS